MIETTMTPLLTRKLKKFAIRSGLAKLDPKIRSRPDLSYDDLKTYSSDVISAPIDAIQSMAAIEALAHQSEPTKPHGEASGIIDLSQGMADFDGIYQYTSEIAKDQIMHPDLMSATRYPSAYGEFETRVAVAKKIHQTTGVSYNPETDVLICNGASQAIAHAVECFVDPGEAIAVIDPCYLFYKWLADIRGIKLLPITKYRDSTTRAGTGYQFRINADAAVKAMRQARLMIVNSPANPDGSMIHPDDLLMLAQLAERNNTIIISDEVYADFCWTNPFTSISSIPEAKPRTIIVSSLSKSHGLPGLRAGWAAGPTSLIQPLTMIMSIRVPCVPGPIQKLVPKLLDLESQFSGKRRAVFENRRNLAITAIRAAGLHTNLPDGAFYLWVDIPIQFKSSETFARWAANDAAVLVIPGEQFSNDGRTKFRLSWGGKADQFQAGISRIHEKLESLDRRTK